MENGIQDPDGFIADRYGNAVHEVAFRVGGAWIVVPLSNSMVAEAVLNHRPAADHMRKMFEYPKAQVVMERVAGEVERNSKYLRGEYK